MNVKEYKELLFRMFLSKEFQSDAAKNLKVHPPDSDVTLGSCNRLSPDPLVLKLWTVLKGVTRSCK